MKIRDLLNPPVGEAHHDIHHASGPPDGRLEDLSNLTTCTFQQPTGADIHSDNSDSPDGSSSGSDESDNTSNSPPSSSHHLPTGIEYYEVWEYSTESEEGPDNIEHEVCLTVEGSEAGLLEWEDLKEEKAIAQYKDTFDIHVGQEVWIREGEGNRTATLCEVRDLGLEDGRKVILVKWCNSSGPAPGRRMTLSQSLKVLMWNTITDLVE
ncbi:Hypothetical protein D9617_44g038910 [Elsinoe fawcettii]|nr:Hypothetical protein D9617_44g038910 [Elsinoe fawcettii]